MADTGHDQALRTQATQLRRRGQIALTSPTPELSLELWAWLSAVDALRKATATDHGPGPAGPHCYPRHGRPGTGSRTELPGTPGNPGMGLLRQRPGPARQLAGGWRDTGKAGGHLTRLIYQAGESQGGTPGSRRSPDGRLGAATIGAYGRRPVLSDPQWDCGRVPKPAGRYAGRPPRCHEAEWTPARVSQSQQQARRGTLHVTIAPIINRRADAQVAAHRRWSGACREPSSVRADRGHQAEQHFWTLAVARLVIQPT